MKITTELTSLSKEELEKLYTNVGKILGKTKSPTVQDIAPIKLSLREHIRSDQAFSSKLRDLSEDINLFVEEKQRCNFKKEIVVAVDFDMVIQFKNKASNTAAYTEDLDQHQLLTLVLDQNDAIVKSFKESKAYKEAITKWRELVSITNKELTVLAKEYGYTSKELQDYFWSNYIYCDYIY